MLLHANFIADRLLARRAKEGAAAARRRWVVGLALLAVLPGLLCQEAASRAAYRLLEVRQERARIAEQAQTALGLEAGTAAAGEPTRRAARVWDHDAGWQKLLTELRDRLPDDLWLTRVELSESGQEGEPKAVRELVVAGRTNNHSAIASLLGSLDESPTFRGATLVSSEPAEGEGEGDTEFEIRAPLATTLHPPEIAP